MAAPMQSRLGIHSNVIGLRAGLPRRFQEQQPVLVIVEDRLPAVSPIHHLVQRSWMLDSELAGHLPAPTLWRPAGNVSAPNPGMCRNFVLTPIRRNSWFSRWPSVFWRACSAVCCRPNALPD